MRVIQLNLNHCEAAQALLQQTVRELNVDVAILCEQYKNMNDNLWVSDTSGKSAIWVCGKHSFQSAAHKDVGFVRVKVNGVFIYSCYAPPNDSLAEFEHLLDKIAKDVREHFPVIVAGDFNSWAVEWGSRVTNRRGIALMEAFSSLPLTLLNTGSKATFSRGNASSIIDLTFISNSLQNEGVNWNVSDLYTHSDHHVIICELSSKHHKKTGNAKREFVGWKQNSFDEAVFRFMMEDMVLSGSANSKSSQIMTAVKKACDASMSRRYEGGQRKAVFWWNEEIAELRRECNHTRRKHQRAKRRNVFDYRQKYRDARAKLKQAIRYSKQRCFANLCAEVDSDPWGRPYRTVMSKFKEKTIAQSCPIILNHIVTVLFPLKNDNINVEIENVAEPIPEVTIDEVLNACSKVGNNKAPGPDCIPNLALKCAIKSYPEKFVEVYDSCLKEGVFPERWKQQKLMLLPKGKKPPEDPSSSRPLCMIDTAGKILESVITNRLSDAVERSGDLAEQQYGFRKGRSTTDAIKFVVEKARNAIAGKCWKGGTMKYCALVTLDVKNAFNSARWSCVFNALKRFQVPTYNIKILIDYFHNRTLTYDTNEGRKEYRITGGVPQGSVLGPILWNILYDDIFRLEVPREAQIVGFADDVAIIVVAKFKEEVVQICNTTVNTICRCKNSTEIQHKDTHTHAQNRQ